MKLPASLPTSVVLLFSLLPVDYQEPAHAAPETSADKRPLVIAHRGGPRWAPENTMAAFRKSLAAGADGIELDIHRCKTGELIVIHDETLDRTTDGSGFIKDKTLSELSSLSNGKWFAREFAGERLPVLEDVLKLVDGKMIINIEIKNAPVEYPGIEEDLKRVLKSYKHLDKILISSFDHELIRRVHEKMPEVKVAFLDAGIVADVGDYAQKIGAKAWNAGYSELRADAVARAHQSGLSVNVWTVDGKKKWDEALGMQVDGIVTDDPAGLIGHLNDRHRDASGN
jgi:glycerophosphoryl diester phosphodiesterase